MCYSSLAQEANSSRVVSVEFDGSDGNNWQRDTILYFPRSVPFSSQRSEALFSSFFSRTSRPRDAVCAIIGNFLFAPGDWIKCIGNDNKPDLGRMEAKKAIAPQHIAIDI